MTKDYALFSLRWIVDGVSFCHDGTVSNHDRLSNGELKCNDQGGHLWVVPVSNTCVNNPMGLAMRLSGAIYTVDRQVVRLSRQNLERCEVTVAIHFSPSGIADARVPIDDFDVDDEHFLEDLMHAFSNGDLDIILDSVSIELSVIEETLTKLGIDPHHHSKSMRVTTTPMMSLNTPAPTNLAPIIDVAIIIRAGCLGMNISAQ